MVDILIKDVDLLCKEDLEKLRVLYEDTFPYDERRDTAEITSNTNDKYIRKAIFYEDVFAGLVCFWELDNFIFVEYLALSKLYRNKGLGREIMLGLIKMNKTDNILLEIEPKTKGIDEMRRYLFYKNIGFKIIEENYMQPAYKKGKKPLQLWLMGLNAVSDKELVISNIYKNVYKI